MNKIVFIGGGNMASAIIGGLLDPAESRGARDIVVVEPDATQRERLMRDFEVHVLEAADASLADAELVVWAVKPQLFATAAEPCARHVAHAVHLSVMAGIRCDAITRATGAERVVRAMPNTPALIGHGATGLYANDAVDPDHRAAIEALLAPTGFTMWVDREADLEAVTAVSGSGPAYVFYFVESMVRAAIDMGLTDTQAKTLALATFAGSTALAQSSDEPLARLRDRVTSKGGATHAAIQSFEADHVAAAIARAMQACQARAKSLGDEFGPA